MRCVVEVLPASHDVATLALCRIPALSCDVTGLGKCRSGEHDVEKCLKISLQLTLVGFLAKQLTSIGVFQLRLRISTLHSRSDTNRLRWQILLPP
jgi:hypothetical protein